MILLYGDITKCLGYKHVHFQHLFYTRNLTVRVEFNFKSFSKTIDFYFHVNKKYDHLFLNLISIFFSKNTKVNI